LAIVVEKMHSQDRPLVLGGISPDTVIWSKDGAVLITEPGFVCDLITRCSDKLLLDAPYAAPEQLVADAVPASDLYAIGATMYFALTGIDPECFTGSEAKAVSTKLDKSLNDLIVTLMNVNPQARGSAAELVHQLGGILPLAASSLGAAQR
jgi:serine/threonine protein kinase